MVEDAGARADGGDTEAPRLKHTRSSRRRLGNAALVYILTSVICVHALVRALGKCGVVRFRNGRFISPVVLDEYLERKSVDAVLREREKETDPFL